MHLEIPQGNIVDVQGLPCHIPPIGYINNIVSRQLEYIGVYKRSEIESEQYWERVPLPDWYKATIKREDDYERKRKEDEPAFYDERYEKYKSQEWNRRLNGFWYYNNGIPTYITGAHYLYMQWISIDIGYPSFRIPDLEYFYFLQYCIEDPLCMGMLEITKRRFGKTFRGGVFVLDYPTRTKMTNGAIQSKTGGDAKKVFAKAIISPFKKLPRFFRPEYDMSLGITPKSEIRFQQTNIRGKKAEEGLDKDELGSMIDFQSADPVAYDGQKIHRYFSDEWAKTVECNIYERHDVVRYCLLDDEGRIIGKALYSSTVEQLETEKEGVQDAAKQLWNDSDHMNKGDNISTASGLYRFFMTADRARNFDRYGYPDVEKTIKAIIADRKTVEHNPRALAARKRKEARTIKEAFGGGTDKCEFNDENIENQKELLEEKPVFLRQCRLERDKEGKIYFMDDKKGGWLLHEKPDVENNYFETSGGYEPRNRLHYQLGIDPVKDDFAVNGSKPTICVFKKSCIKDGEETGMKPVALYIDKTRLDVHFDDEVLKAVLWYGCTANYELDSRTDYYRYFVKMKAGRFLEWTPKVAIDPIRSNFKVKPGTQSGDPFQLATQLQICKMYIDGTSPDIYNGHVHRIVFPTLLQQLLDYDHADRTKSDQVISLMMALLPVLGSTQMPERRENRPNIQILPIHKIKVS
jgi:hypothetical protein